MLLSPYIRTVDILYIFAFFFRLKQIIQRIPFQSVTILSQVLLHVANYVQHLKKFGELFNKKFLL